MKIRGTVTPGWAQPGEHGPKREGAIIYGDLTRLTIVRETGKRIYVELWYSHDRMITLAFNLDGADFVFRDLRDWIERGDC